MLEPTKVELFMGLCSIGMLPTFPTSIKLMWHQFAVANTIAYYNTATIMAIKSFIVQAQELIQQRNCVVNLLNL